MIYYILIIIFVIFSILIGISIYFTYIIIHPKTIDHSCGYAREVKLGRIDPDVYSGLKKEEVIIKSPYGYSLFGLFFNNNSRITIIICHGISLNLFSSIKYLPLYVNRGYNILVYDHRNHGNSGGKTTTYGYYEKYDLKACVDWVINHCGTDSTIGVHGESMGAAIAMQYAALERVVSFYVIDCPFSDLTSQFVIRAKDDYGLPSFPLINLCGIIHKLLTGVSFNQVSPIQVIATIETPMLFIHGSEDRYVPTKMSIDLYNRKNGIKRIYIAPNSGHVESYTNNPEEYNEALKEFLHTSGIE